jgi:uncharacterized protein (UPF0276 family)
MPYTEASLRHVVERVERVQAILGRPLLLENVSSYVSWKGDELTEWEFLSSLTSRTGCKLLFDVNNAYVNAFNHGFQPETFVDALPVDAVAQMHLAGHRHCGTHLFDDHGSEVSDPVWALYERAVRRFGAIPTIIEWDGDVPPLERVVAESHTAQRVGTNARAARSREAA